MVKLKAPKPSKSRPVSTSELNQPLLPSSGSVTASTASCSFSPAPDHTLFAHISNQIHQQRLRVYNASASAASSSQLVTDFLLSSLGGAECLSSHWVRLSTSSSKSAKRRKHDAKGSDDVASSGSSQLFLALGLSTGQVHLLSPALAQSVAVLDASSASGSSTSSAANAGIVSMFYSEGSKSLFTCSKSGWVSSFALGDIKLGDQITPLRPFSSFRPDTKSAVQLLSSRQNLVLSAHHSISLNDVAQSDHSLRATFTGHASPVTHLEWINDNSFLSAAEGDRIVSAWTFEATAGKAVTGRTFATAALDGPVRALSVSTTSAQQSRTLITIVTQTGSVRVYGLPAEPMSDASPSKKKSAALPSLELLAQSSIESGGASVEWIDARLVSDKLRLARLLRGAKVSIDETTVLSGKDAQLQKTITLPTAGGKQNSSADTDGAQLTGGANDVQRYTDAPLRPEYDAALEAGLEDAGLVASSSTKAADMEPTLAQRLKDLGFGDPSLAGQEADEDDADVPTKKQQALMNEASLASSLSQALHSGDTSLLTSCLNHNDPILIRNTVRKISGPLAVKLLEESVSRLNGVGGHHVSKGSMGSQKARGLMEWVRATLLNHMGYLMSLPNLVNRLSGLHATLTQRLATHERLLALNGRLELVLSQIEARAAYMSQASNNQVRVQGVKFGKKMQGNAVSQAQNGVDKERRKGKKWVEESDDSDSDDMAVDGDQDGVLVRGDDSEDGDVQDIALGADDSDDDEDDDSDDDGPVRRRRRARNGRMSDGNTSADSASDDDEDDGEGIKEDEYEEELPDESDIEEEGASDMEDDDDEEEYDEEDGGRDANSMFDLEAEEGTDEDDED
ncbi:related to UTP5 - U3 snoRNP protein [Ustilago sp. UG-2017a]|nr:related to UTP5 - U3 snoRNP protein [Ustilago sp. UG-2017a]